MYYVYISSCCYCFVLVLYMLWRYIVWVMFLRIQKYYQRRNSSLASIAAVTTSYLGIDQHEHMATTFQVAAPEPSNSATRRGVRNRFTVSSNFGRHMQKNSRSVSRDSDTTSYTRTWQRYGYCRYTFTLLSFWSSCNRQTFQQEIMLS